MPYLAEHAEHGGNALFDGPLAVDHFDERRIQPDAFPVRRPDPAAVLLALADDGRSGDVAGLQGIDERHALSVDELRAQRAHFLRHQRPVNLRGSGRTRGVILQRFGIEQLCARAIGEDEPVRRSAVMVGGGEALIVQPSRAARGENDRLGARHENFAVSMFWSTAPAALPSLSLMSSMAEVKSTTVMPRLSTSSRSTRMISEPE